MYKRPQPLSKDVSDYENYSSKNKSFEQPHSETRSLEYFINNRKTIDILRKKNIKELYPIQCQTFRPILQGFDLIARDRTGSGKTLAFTLPVLQRLRQAKKFQHKYPKFLIILPTRQLAIQVHNEIQSLRYRNEDDFQSYVVYGKTSIEENIRKLKGGVDILVATPGRLNDLISRGAVRLESIEVLCLDQADQILKQGFKEEIEKVFSEIHKCNKNKIQILLFSATIPPWLRSLSEQYQGKDTPYINMIKDDDIRTSKTIKHFAAEISRMGDVEIVQLIEQMVDKYGGYEKRILIFCDKKVDVDSLSRRLKIQNEPLHGDVNQSRRQNAYRNFKAGVLRCIVATNVAARGLDFPSVDLVIQMAPPLNTEEYIHRAGRTGRAGKQGTCLTFFDRTRTRIISKIESQANIRIEVVNISKTTNSRGDSERNNNFYSKDSYEGNSRNSRQENNYTRDRYERNDRNTRDEPEKRNEQYGARRDNRFQSRNSSANNEDPRMKQNQRNSGPERNDNRDSRQIKDNQQQRNRSSRSKSRQFSKSRSNSPKRGRSPSPKKSNGNSPKFSKQEKLTSSQRSTPQELDY